MLDFWMWAAALALLAVAPVIYNVYFHPLRNFPGPPMAGATTWWRAYIEVYRGESLTHKLFDLHEQYGDVIRISPNEVSFRLRLSKVTAHQTSFTFPDLPPFTRFTTPRTDGTRMFICTLRLALRVALFQSATTMSQRSGARFSSPCFRKHPSTTLSVWSGNRQTTWPRQLTLSTMEANR